MNRSRRSRPSGRYTQGTVARSKVAEDLGREDALAVAAMTPDERLRLAFELGRRAVDMYMEAHHVDFATAVRALKRAGQAGRQYSRCMDEEGP